MKQILFTAAALLFAAPVLSEAQTSGPEKDRQVQTGAANTFRQTIRGRVTDNDGISPLPGASVIIVGSNPVIGAAADANGYFRIDNVPVGKQTLKVSYIGFGEKIIPNVQVNSGRQTELNLKLQESIAGTEEVTVTAKRKGGDTGNEMAAVSGRSFSPDETRRYAGALNDPSRMASTYAGVSGDASGNNDIIVRGNSPRGMLWRMEGVEIPNPNHFANEGSSGGPINIINPNVLGNSAFYTGAFPAAYGNALSGVFDLGLRSGNNKKNEFVLQAGTIGIEAGAEGPLKAGSDASYVANYRYSSLALFSAAGLDIAGEAVPEFQDATFKVRVPTKNAGVFTLYGIGGISNVKDSDTDPNGIKRSKFVGNYGFWASGLKHLYFLNANTFTETNLAYSGTYMGNNESERLNGPEDVFTPTYSAGNTYSNYRLNSYINHKFNARNRMEAGLTYSLLGYRIKMDDYDRDLETRYNVYDRSGTAALFQPYANWQFRPTDALTLNAGMHLMHFSLSGQTAAEPRLGLSWQQSEKHTFSLGSGLHSRLDPVSTYFSRVSPSDSNNIGGAAEPNRKLRTSRAFHQVLGHQWFMGGNLSLKTELYYQYIFDVPVGTGSDAYFSTINATNAGYNTLLVNKGKGRNFGADFTLERSFADNMYLTLTQSVYRSQFQNPGSEWQSTRYDQNFVTNVIGGKEWKLKSSANKQRTLMVNLRALVSGGIRYSPVNLEKSRAAGTSRYDDDKYLSQQAPVNTRFDMAIGLRTNRAKTTQTLKLDIYNVLNAAPVSEEYYSSYEDKIKKSTGLGILPNLSYRFEF
ncbi:MAG: carboxypeptidase regulatory-like domain-containing protein [Bacteroidota bacterium]